MLRYDSEFWGDLHSTSCIYITVRLRLYKQHVELNFST